MVFDYNQDDFVSGSTLTTFLCLKFNKIDSIISTTSIFLNLIAFIFASHIKTFCSPRILCTFKICLVICLLVSQLITKLDNKISA